MRKANAFPSDSDYTDMCYTQPPRAPHRLNMLPVPRLQNPSCPGSDDGSTPNKSRRWYISNLHRQQIAESTETKTHPSIKFSNKNSVGTPRPKSARRTLVIGPIHGLRANKQPDTAFRVFCTDDCVNNPHV